MKNKRLFPVLGMSAVLSLLVFCMMSLTAISAPSAEQSDADTGYQSKKTISIVATMVDSGQSSTDYSDYLILLALLILGSQLYARVRGKKPEYLFALSSIPESIRQVKAVWWFLLPVLLVLGAAYNVLAYLVWFVAEVIHWSVGLLMWCYENIIRSGLFFLTRNIWHYLFVWPWRLFLRAFELMRSAVGMGNYIKAAVGLAFAFLLPFLGKYIGQHFLSDSAGEDAALQNAIRFFFTLLSLIPAGLACVSIISGAPIRTIASSTQGKKYLRPLVWVIGGFLLLILAEAFLVFLGSMTSFVFSISAVLAGGNMFLSLLMLLNGALFLFVLSALPSFSIGFDGNVRSFFPSFFRYLVNKWPRYLLTIPAIILPGIFLVLIPSLITGGIAFVANKAVDVGMKPYISGAKEQLARMPAADYNAWSDVDSFSATEVDSLMSLDLERLQLQHRLDNIQRTHDYLTGVYSAHAKENGAITVTASLKLVDTLEIVAAERMKMEKPVLTVTDLSDLLEASNNNATAVESQQAQSDNITQEINRLEEGLRNVCVMPKSDKPESITVVTPKEEGSGAILDSCEKRRVLYRDSIDFEKNRLEISNKNLERLTAIKKHLDEIKIEAAALASQSSFSASFAHLFIGLWLCLLLALSFAPLLALFALVNHTVHQDEEESPWLINEEIRTARSANPNQPLLGLILLLFSVAALRFINPWNAGEHFNKIYGASKEMVAVMADKTGGFTSACADMVRKASLRPLLEYLELVEAGNGESALQKPEGDSMSLSEAPAAMELPDAAPAAVPEDPAAIAAEALQPPKRMRILLVDFPYEDTNASLQEARNRADSLQMEWLNNFSFDAQAEGFGDSEVKEINSVDELSPGLREVVNGSSAGKVVYVDEGNGVITVIKVLEGEEFRAE